MKLRVWLVIFCGGIIADGALAPKPAVDAELVIPFAATYVIGDPIPLVWRFKNISDKPLGFMWEGCCRLNGRLEVTQLGQILTPIPPGEAMAHMFAKAERLEPGHSRDFETHLSDWASLSDSGTYELQGQYVGVLPQQQPQVARGLSLWRDTAVTAPIQLTVLKTTDYLRQRAERGQARGLTIELRGPSVLPPQTPVSLRAMVINTSQVTQRAVWPSHFQLWVMTHSGQRLREVAGLIKAPYTEIALPPGSRWTNDIPFAADQLEGQPFGTYEVFLDLAADGPQTPRVPSNSLSIRWELTQNDVASLINRATAGPAVGARNAPLKLLRTYLTEIKSSLVALNLGSSSPSAAELARQLQLAAHLKPLAPKPGRVDWEIAVNADGHASFIHPLLNERARDLNIAVSNRVAALFSVRRHLGWDVGLVLKPENETTIARLKLAADQLRTFEPELAAPLHLRPFANNSNVVIHLRHAAVAAAGVIEVTRSANEVRIGVLRVSQGLASFSSFTRMKDEMAVREWLAAMPEKSPHLLVLPSSDLLYGQLLDLLRPLARSGATVDLKL